MSLRGAWWLVLRMLRDARHRGSLLLVAAICLLSGLVMQGISSVPWVLDARDAAGNAFTVSGSPRPTGLYADRSTWNWREKSEIVVMRVAAEGRGRTALPGTTRPMEPGDLWVSPGLRQAMDADDDLARILPPVTAGTIDPAVLPNPRAKYLYVGATVQQMRLNGFRSTAVIGVPEDGGIVGTRPPALEALLMLTAVLVLGVPLIVLLGGVLSLLTFNRSRQVDSLVVIGVPLGRARFLLGLDGLLVALACSLVSVPLFTLLVRVLSDVPGTPASWQPGHPRPTVLGLLAAIALPVVAALLATRQGRATRDAAPKKARVVRPWMAVPALIALAGMVAARDLPIDLSAGNAAVAVGLVAFLALALPVLTSVVSSVVARVVLRIAADRPGWQVGSARIVRGFARSSRPSALIASVVVLGIAVAPLAAQATASGEGAKSTQAQTGRIIFQVDHLPTAIDVTDWQDDPGVIAAVRSRTVSTGASAATVFPVSCEVGKIVFNRTDCKPGRRTKPSALPAFEGFEFRGWSVIEAASSPERLGPVGHSVLVVVTDVDALWRVVATAHAADPVAEVLTAYDNAAGGDLDSLQVWLRLAMVQLLLVLGVVLVVAGVEDLQARAGQHRALAFLGVSRSTVRGMVFRELLIRNAALAATALVAAAVVGDTATQWSGTDPLPSGWILGIVVVLLAVAALAVIVPTVLAGRHRPGSSSPRE